MVLEYTVLQYGLVISTSNLNQWKYFKPISYSIIQFFPYKLDHTGDTTNKEREA